MIKLFFITLLLFCSSLNSWSHPDTCLNFHSLMMDTSNFFKEECIKSIQKLTPSMNGKTEQGNTYTLYAIRKGKDWTYLILDQTGYYSLKQVKGKEEISENSSAYTDMIAMMAKARMIKKFSKPKNVGGMTFACYYKFRPKARTMYRQYSFVQNKARSTKRKAKQVKKGVDKVMKKKK